MSQAWKPHAGQKRAVKFLLEHAAAGLFADPGVGKTSSVFAAFKMLKKRGLAERMLVIAPLKPCYLVWPKEREKWSDFYDLRVEVLHGPHKEDALGRDADVYVINPDGLPWLLGAALKKSAITGKMSATVDLKRFKAFQFDTLVVDELTQFKHQSSGRFKMLKQVLGTFGRRWGLTGTPVPNGLIDLFGQCFVLDQGRSLGQYITHYRNKYFVPSWDGNTWHLRKGAEDEIYDRIKPLALRLEAKDFVDMPELVENVVKFDLPPAARKAYDDMEANLITQLDEKVVSAANAASASTKLRQLVNGGIYLDDDLRATFAKQIKAKGARDWVSIHDEKTDLLEGLIEELQGTPLLVAYDFRHDLERLQARFGKNIPYIGGGTTPKRATELEAAWNRGELPVLYGHPQSMGHGLNLQGAGNHVCWYGMTWNRELYDQLNGRVRRQGSVHQTVFVHHLMARDTIDETMFWALRAKGKVQTALLDALKELRKKRKG